MPTFEEQRQRVQQLTRDYRALGMDRKTARAKAEADALAESKPVAPEDNNLVPEGTDPFEGVDLSGPASTVPFGTDDPNAINPFTGTSDVEGNAAIIAEEPEYDDGYVEPEAGLSEEAEEIKTAAERAESVEAVDSKFAEVGEAASSGLQYNEAGEELANDPDYPGETYEEKEARLQKDIEKGGKEFEKEMEGRDAERERLEKEGQEDVQRKTEQYARELDEKSKDPSSLLYRSPQYRMHVKRLEGILANLGKGRGISAEDSKWVQQYREEVAAKEAKVQADKDRGVVSRGIMDDPQMIATTRRVNAEVDAKNEALRREGFETNQETIPVIDLEEGGAIGGGMYDPRLTKTVNVYNEKGDVIRQIQKDIPGARKELAQRMAAEGKVRMRATKGGYVRAAADEPYSRGDIYMSNSQADRAESTVKDRSKEKKRRKGLLARNKLFNRGFRDSKNPLSYGKNAASVRIAQIMADAEKAKAEAEARIKADDTLSDHEKQLAIIKATAEINAAAAETQNEFDAGQSQLQMDSAETIAGVEQEQTATALQQVEWERQRDALQSQIDLQVQIVAEAKNTKEKVAAEKVLRALREKMRILNNKILGAAATDPAQADGANPLEHDDEGLDFDDADIDLGELEEAEEGTPQNPYNAQTAERLLREQQGGEQLYQQLVASIKPLMEFTSGSTDETNVEAAYTEITGMMGDGGVINEDNISVVGPIISSFIHEAGFRRKIEWMRTSTQSAFFFGSDVTHKQMYQFFMDLFNGKLPTVI